MFSSRRNFVFFKILKNWNVIFRMRRLESSGYNQFNFYSPMNSCHPYIHTSYLIIKKQCYIHTPQPNIKKQCYIERVVYGRGMTEKSSNTCLYGFHMPKKVSGTIQQCPGASEMSQTDFKKVFQKMIIFFKIRGSEGSGRSSLVTGLTWSASRI